MTMSPFKYKFSAEIKRRKEIYNFSSEISIIKEYIESRKGLIISIEHDKLIFKKDQSRISNNMNVFGLLILGCFEIKEYKNRLLLTYEIKIDRMIIFLCFTGIIFGAYLILHSPENWFLCMPLLWLGGMNWLTILIRNSLVLNDIQFLINNEKIK